MLTASEFIVIVLLAGVFMLLCSAFISYVLYRRKVLRLWTNYLMERSFWFFNIENRYVQGDLADDTMTGYFRVEWCFSYQDKFFKKGIHAFSVRNWDGEDLNPHRPNS